jgi:hypothetical protein
MMELAQPHMESMVTELIIGEIMVGLLMQHSSKMEAIHSLSM